MKTTPRVEELLRQMTLREKAAQLTQLDAGCLEATDQGGLTGPLSSAGFTEEEISEVGSALSVFGAERIKKIQQEHLRRSRLKIPLLFMGDVIHGYRTVYPIPLALGSSWDEQLMEDVARASAREAAADGLMVTFSPMVDPIRDSRWGRTMESTGEDPFLNSLAARAFVRGYQSDTCANPGQLACCVKHFIGYGFPEGGREYNTVDISAGVLRDFCLPPYQAAVDEGCEMVMASFNIVDRIPAAANKKLLTGILRREMGFTGVTISDWGAVQELTLHAVAQNGQEAAALALNAGLDIEMMSPNYIRYLPQLVKDGAVSEQQLDDAVRRVLCLKEKLGLFDNPYKDLNAEQAEKLFLSAEHRKLAREAACKSAVLLKNSSSLLPLKKGSFCLAGPFADSKAMRGGWALLGKDEDCVSLYEGMAGYVGGENVTVAPWDERDLQACIQTTLEMSKEADCIICTCGEPQEEIGECTSKADLALPAPQLAFLEALWKAGKKVVAVVFAGRGLELAPVCRYTQAVLLAWYLGTESGNALADLLLGYAAPSGRLTISLPIKTGQMPLYYNCYNTGRPKYTDRDDRPFVSKYIDCANQPLCPFGYGLGYTSFSYGAVTASERKLHPGESIEISVEVENTGNRCGTETVQLYIRDICASVVRPLRELKGFRRVVLEPGQKQRVRFELTEEMLRFWNEEGRYGSQAGEFEVYVGANCMDCESVRIFLEAKPEV